MKGYSCQSPFQDCISASGHKHEWPELIGKDSIEAKRIIESENPYVHVFFLPSGDIRIFDYCCDRVIINVSKLGGVVVAPYPIIG
ncbi:hypothetical protein RND81_08G159600 [Saponaria officinalis]|uniref:Uncharacterized protein n=1 Tax=Saponaria officinalis TaxID=3572 RepID=A0AAW1J7Y4_SAPOF